MCIRDRAQAKENGAKVKVGVVIFNKEAHKSDFMDLETQYDAIEAAIRENISSGTNLSAGILAGKKMLDEDTQVAAGRKSLVLLSDGITYIFGEKPTAVAWGFENDGSEHSWAGPDHWSLKSVSYTHLLPASENSQDFCAGAVPPDRGGGRCPLMESDICLHTHKDASQLPEDLHRHRDKRYRALSGGAG